MRRATCSVTRGNFLDRFMPHEGPRRAAALNALWRGAGCDTLRLGAAMGPPNQGNQAMRDETPNFTFARLDLTPNVGVLAKLRHMPLARQTPTRPGRPRGRRLLPFAVYPRAHLRGSRLRGKLNAGAR